jgi:hypothetical protein
MLPLYLFCLIVGGGLLLFSLAGSASDDVADLGENGTMAHEFFSTRALSYFLAGFGATGFLVETVTDASTGTALVWAAATGVVGAAAVALVYGYLRGSESGVLAMDSDHLTGLPARVTLAVTRGQRGKIVVVSGGGRWSCSPGSTVPPIRNVRRGARSSLWRWMVIQRW